MGQDYSELLSIARQKEKISSRLFSRRREYATIYHFSDQRENAVSWLPIGKKDRVLDFSAGAGALTGALAFLSGHTDAAEEDEELLEVLKYRYGFSAEVTILAGKQEETLKDRKGFYDWVIVSEWKEVLPEGRLSFVRSLLKPEGRLVLLLTNPYGLKFFAGCAEEESGRYFEGIEGCSHGGPQALALSAWKKRLKEAGFSEKDTRSFYPFPDHVFPTHIFSDDFLPEKGLLKNDTYNLDFDRLRLFDEQKAWDHILEDGLFPQFSNSYIIVAGLSDQPTKQERIIYVKHSGERTEKYAILTEILEAPDGKRRVEKIAAGPAARAHVENMERVWQDSLTRMQGTPFVFNRCEKKEAGRLSFEYLSGTDMDLVLDEYRDSEENWIKYGEPLIRRYTDLMRQLYGQEDFVPSPEFKEMFGDPALPAGLKGACGMDIDLIFQNIRVEGDAWNVIDYEWTFPFMIPVNYVIYRCLYFYCHLNEKRMRLKNPAFFEKFGITRQEMDLYARMEQHFQGKVTENYVPMRQIAYASGKREFYLETLLDAQEKLENMPAAPAAAPAAPAALQEPEKKNMFEKIVGKLQAFREKRANEAKTLFTSVDQITGDYVFVRVRGWAWSRVKNPVDLILLDSKQQEVPFELREVNRPDVAQALLGEAKRLYAGFEIQFVSEDESYTLILRDGKQEERKQILVSEICLPKVSEVWSIGPGYEDWWEENAASEEELERQKEDTLPVTPRFSVLVPTYRTPEQYLREMIDSVLAQTYPNWQLCIADGSGEDDSVARVLAEYTQKDERIVFSRLKANEGISGNTNAALQMADGDWVALLDHDDLLAPDALYELASYIGKHPEAGAVYTDEDKVSMDLSLHFDAVFKPDFNLDYLRSCNYICHLFAVKKELADRAGGFHSEFDGSQDYDFILRCTEMAGETGHIAKILYHWRAHPASTAENPESKAYCYEAGKKAVQAHYDRLGIRAVCERYEKPGYYRTSYEEEEKPSVSVIRFSPEERPSGGELNRLARETDGRYLLFLNEKAELPGEEDLRRLAADAARPDVGAVSAKILNGDGMIYHAGMILGLGGPVGYPYAGYLADEFGYFGRAGLKMDESSVPLDLLMIRREAFEGCGGFDEGYERHLADTDLCLKLREKGLRILYDPDVTVKLTEKLQHPGTSLTDPDAIYLLNKWEEVLETCDPCYTPHLSLQGVGYKL